MQKGQTTMADLNNELDLNAPVAPTLTLDSALSLIHISAPTRP